MTMIIFEILQEEELFAISNILDILLMRKDWMHV